MAFGIEVEDLGRGVGRATAGLFPGVPAGAFGSAAARGASLAEETGETAADAAEYAQTLDNVIDPSGPGNLSDLFDGGGSDDDDGGGLSDGQKLVLYGVGLLVILWLLRPVFETGAALAEE